MPSNKPTLFKRKNSRWWWFSWYTEQDRIQGSLKELGLTVADYTKEQAAEIVLQQKGLGLEATESGTETLQWFKDEIRRRVERERLATGTLKLYKDAIDRLIVMYGKDYPVNKIKRSDVGKLQDHLLSKGITPAFVNLVCRHLRAAFERLYDDEMIGRNPFRKFKALKERSGKPLHLTENEVQRFLESVRTESNEEHRRLIYIYLFTGRRRREILGIRREDVDLKNNTVWVTNIKDREKKKQLITIPEVIRGSFEWFMERTHSEMPFNVCHPTTISKKVKFHIRAAGLSESYHLHTLRHTFVTLALKSGENIWKIKDWLGHSTVKVTEIYAHDKPGGEINIGINLSEQE